jgi:hypothetical protein
MASELQPYKAPSTPALKAGPLDYPTVLALGKAFAASGLFPGVKDEGVAAVKILAGAEFGLEPVSAMNHIDIIATKDRPPRLRLDTDAQALLAARAGYTYEPIEHSEQRCILRWSKNGKVIKIADGKGNLVDATSEFTVAQATNARLVRDGGAWQAWPMNMTLARAITQGIKLYCRHVLAGSIGGMQVVTTDELEQEYPDPRDDLMKALFAAYREVFPQGPAETKETYRQERHDWSERILGRAISSWNGPEAPETLTRADVQTLIDALEATQPALARELAAPALSTPPVAVSGTESTAPQSSAGEVVTGHAVHSVAPDDGMSGTAPRTPPAPAEHHTAEVREAALADGTMPGGPGRSDTGQPSGSAPTPAATAKAVADGLYEKAFGRRPAPTRKHPKVDLTDEARKAAVVRNAGRREIYHPPTVWLWTLPTEERIAVLERFGNTASKANAWLADWCAQERDADLPPLEELGEDWRWPAKKLALLRESLKAEGSTNDHA